MPPGLLALPGRSKSYARIYLTTLLSVTSRFPSLFLPVGPVSYMRRGQQVIAGSDTVSTQILT